MVARNRQAGRCWPRRRPSTSPPPSPPRSPQPSASAGRPWTASSSQCGRNCSPAQPATEPNQPLCCERPLRATGSRLPRREPCARSMRGVSVATPAASRQGAGNRRPGFGTEGHRFESSRARFAVRLAGGDFSAVANAAGWQHRGQRGNSEQVAPRADRAPGIYRRGSRYVGVYRVEGCQRKQYEGALAEARAMKGTRATARRGRCAAAPRCTGSASHTPPRSCPPCCWGWGWGWGWGRDGG
jgi:hypothetical protein